MAKKVIIATNNAHKVEEISDFFSALDWECESLAQAGIDSNPEETGTTLIENARIKARAAHELSGCAVLADDSGLLVDALDGAPGVYSSRYAGEDRSETTADGRVEGLIGFEERGSEGFGYDPLFLPDDFNNEYTFAELGLAEKQKVSHRARALRALMDKLS